jgi:hypothetical protein
MAFTSGTVTVTTAVTPICPAGPGETVTVKNTGTADVYLGGQDVTTAGFPLGSRETQTVAGPVPSPVWPSPPDGNAPVVLYGVTRAGSSDVAWLAA